MIDGLLGYFVFGNIAFRLQTNRGFLFRYLPQAIATPNQSIKPTEATYGRKMGATYRRSHEVVTAS